MNVSSVHARANVSNGDAPNDDSPNVSPVRVVQRQVVGIVALIAGLCVAGLALIEAPLIGAIDRWDESVSRRLTGDRSVEATEFAQFVSQAGDTRPVLVLMGVITVLVALGGQWRPVVFVPLAMLAEISTFLAINYIVGRPRPAVDKIGPIPSTFSFPSGHVHVQLSIRSRRGHVGVLDGRGPAVVHIPPPVARPSGDGHRRVRDCGHGLGSRVPRHASRARCGRRITHGHLGARNHGVGPRNALRDHPPRQHHRAHGHRTACSHRLAHRSDGRGSDGRPAISRAGEPGSRRRKRRLISATSGRPVNHCRSCSSCAIRSARFRARWHRTHRSPFRADPHSARWPPNGQATFGFMVHELSDPTGLGAPDCCRLHPALPAALTGQTVRGPKPGASPRKPFGVGASHQLDVGEHAGCLGPVHGETGECDELRRSLVQTRCRHRFCVWTTRGEYWLDANWMISSDTETQHLQTRSSPRRPCRAKYVRCRPSPSDRGDSAPREALVDVQRDEPSTDRGEDRQHRDEEQARAQSLERNRSARALTRNRIDNSPTSTVVLQRQHCRDEDRGLRGHR